MKKDIIFLLFLFMSQLCVAQVLSFTKVEVQANGSVDLAWSGTGLAGTFQKVELSKRAGGSTSFTPIYSNTSSVSSFSDMGTNANNESFDYQVVITTSANTYTDHASSVFLKTETQQTEDVFCKLSWNAPKSPLTEKAYIYRKLPSGSWVLIDSTTQLEYTDMLPFLCEAHVSYYIEYAYAGPSLLKSNTSDIVIKRAQPGIPVWSSVSVDKTSQKMKLSWEPSPNKKISGYYICSSSPNENYPCIKIDSVTQAGLISFVCDTCDPEKTYYFKIYAFDSCGYSGAQTKYQNNMVLTVGVENCPQKIHLSWNSYKNMEGGLGGYRIFAELDNGPTILIGTTDTLTTLFTYSPPLDTREGIFYIESFNLSNSIQANSSFADVKFTTPYIEILSASVKENNREIELQIGFDPSLINQEHFIYKGTNGKEPKLYSRITPQSTDFTYADTEVNAGTFYYSYYIKTKEGCLSNISSPMRLNLYAQDSSDITLIWNSYEGWEKVSFYDIYMKTSGTNWVRIGTVQGDDTLFVYSVWDKNPNRIFFKVIANTSDGKTATSSMMEYIRKGYLIVPNAFTPKSPSGSPNASFKPVCFYMVSEGYSLTIFNRNGEALFNTTHPDIGWDGKYKGKYCPMGAYVYLIQCIYSSGLSETKSGTVLLLE